jgi:hypothetical protein
MGSGASPRPWAPGVRRGPEHDALPRVPPDDPGHGAGLRVSGGVPVHCEQTGRARVRGGGGGGGGVLVHCVQTVRANTLLLHPDRPLGLTA